MSGSKRGQSVKQARRRLLDILARPEASNTTALVVGLYASAIIGLATTALAAGLLGPETFGLAAIVMAYPRLLWSLVEVKSAAVTTRYMAIYREAGDTEKLAAVCQLGYTVDLGLAIAAGLLVIVSSGLVAEGIYARPEAARSMMLYATSFPFFSLIATSQSILSVWGRFKSISVQQVVGKAAVLLTVIILVAGRPTLDRFVLGLVIGEIASGLVMFVPALVLTARSGIRWWAMRPSRAWRHRESLISQLGWNYVLLVTAGSLANVPVLLTGSVVSIRSAGYVRLAQTIATAGTYLESSLGRVVYPLLSRRWTTDTAANLARTMRRWTVLAGVPSAMLLLGAAALLPLLVPLVFDDAFRPATTLSQLLLGSVAMSTLVFWTNPAYYAANLISQYVKLSGAYVTLTLALATTAIMVWRDVLAMVMILAGGRIAFSMAMARAMLQKLSSNDR